MAIFKAVTTPRGTSVGHAKPDKLEDYLKYQRDEDGRVVKEGREKQARDVLLTSLNTEDMTVQELQYLKTKIFLFENVKER